MLFEGDEYSNNKYKNEKNLGEEEHTDSLDYIFNPTEESSELLSKEAKKQASRIMKKMEKIQVAPGEFGKFRNWGDEIFLEEKCFPDKFPFGTGGYLSSCIDNPEKDMGFANYCIQKIMSADPKFRNDSTYLFFLLLVKELIMLKQCKSTYLRQATQLPNLGKEDLR